MFQQAGWVAIFLAICLLDRMSFCSRHPVSYANLTFMQMMMHASTAIGIVAMVLLTPYAFNPEWQGWTGVAVIFLAGFVNYLFVHLSGQFEKFELERISLSALQVDES